jgi:hypothetical protein
MSDSRVARAGGRDEGALLLGGARARATVAAADLFLPEGLRLSEWQRTTMADLLAKLIRTIEDDLRASLAESFPAGAHDAVHAALTSSHVAIALPILMRSKGLTDQDLVNTLIRRAEEHRLHRSAVAAALRHYLVEQHAIPGEQADEALAMAAVRLIAAYDEGDALEARCMRLARRLWETGRLDDVLVERLAADGGLPIFLAAMAVRTALHYAAAWEIFADPSRRGAALLLLAAEIGREQAASILLSLHAPGELVHGAAAADVAEQLDLYDMTDGFEARAALRLWQVDPAYRAAIGTISPEPAGEGA